MNRTPGPWRWEGPFGDKLGRLPRLLGLADVACKQVLMMLRDAVKKAEGGAE